MQSGRYLEKIPDEKLELTMKVNVLAHMHICKAFLPSFIKRNHGHFIAVASMAGLIGASGMSDYAASKFGCLGFYESLNLEMFERGLNIQCSVVCPTLIDTGLFKGFHVP